MKKILLLLLFLFSLNCNAEEKTCEPYYAEGLTSEETAQRGCCSRHGGVCKCSGGRVVCCDGKLSPSCTCNKDESMIYRAENLIES